jgi:hypothetical protein
MKEKKRIATSLEIVEESRIFFRTPPMCLINQCEKYQTVLLRIEIKSQDFADSGDDWRGRGGLQN